MPYAINPAKAGLTYEHISTWDVQYYFIGIVAAEIYLTTSNSGKVLDLLFFPFLRLPTPY